MSTTDTGIKRQGWEIPVQNKPGPKNGAEQLAMGDLSNTKYRPEMCDQIIELGKEGMSKLEMAVTLGIGRAGIDHYAKLHPQFSEALKQALDNSQAWWERQGRQITFAAGPMFNATSYIFQMKNRFREDWNDTRINNNTNEDGPRRADAESKAHDRLAELVQRIGSIGTGDAVRDAPKTNGTGEFSVLHQVHRGPGRPS